MKLSLLAAIVSILFLTAVPETARAAPARLIAPSVQPTRTEVRSICHHYRWSSKRHCTSAKTLRFVARPPLFYPSRYFADRPHYYYEQRLYYWRSWYAHHRWYRWPYYRY